METIHIEWRHYDKAGSTCDRCSDTGTHLKQVVEEYARRGIAIELQETLLDASQLAESNMILMNGIALEELLAGASASESVCPSCSCLTGTAASCRTVHYQGITYEDLSPELISKGIETVLAIR